MVEIKDIYRMEEKLEELSVFFSRIQSCGNKLDTEGAGYGLNKIAFIKGAIAKYKANTKQIHLKQIYSGFSSLSRGVEFFTDVETDELFKDKCKNLYQILDELKQKIKW